MHYYSFIHSFIPFRLIYDCLTTIIGGLLAVERIIATELTSADLLGKNDPIVYFRFGDRKDIQKTKAIMDAGEIALWDEEQERIDVDFEVSKSQLMDQCLYIEVYDYNATGDTLIGSGYIDECKNLLASMGETKEMDMCTLVDKDNKVHGHVKLFMSLHDRRYVCCCLPLYYYRYIHISIHLCGVYYMYLTL